MTPLTIGIDLGTSSVKVVALGLDGQVRATAQVRYGVDRPRPSWAEQDPRVWWAATCEALRALRTEDASPVVAVGLSGQMHGLVAVDRAGEPVRPAIIWSDARSHAQVERWTHLLTPARVGAATGMPIATGMLGVSLSWVRENEPAVYDRIHRVFSPKDWIRARLTGLIATDPTDAAAGLLYDIRAGQPATLLAAGVDLDADLLAEVLPTLSIAGRITPVAADQSGLPVDVPVAVGGGDQAMAALALGLHDATRAAVALSSGGTAFQRTPGPLASDRGLHVMPFARPGEWMAMGVVLAAGLGVDWLLGRVAGGDTSPERIAAVMSDAADVVAGARGLVVVPHLGGTRTPVVDAAARARITGLGFEHDLAHIVRGFVEGVCVWLGDAVDELGAAGSPASEIVISGGGARFDVWRRTLADATGLPVHVSSDVEHSAIGAALAGAEAAGIEIDFDARARVSLVIEPDAAVRPVYRELSQRVRADLYADRDGTRRL